MTSVTQLQHPSAKTTMTLHSRSKVESTDDSSRPMKKKFKCKVANCDHAPFAIQYGLVQHVIIKHKKQGKLCNICGCIMSEYYLEGHMDTHCVSNRYICKEKKRDGNICNQDSHQKQGLVRHLKVVHSRRSYNSAKVHVLEKKECVYETKNDYLVGMGECNLNNEMVNDMVNQFGETVYV